MSGGRTWLVSKEIIVCPLMDAVDSCSVCLCVLSVALAWLASASIVEQQTELTDLHHACYKERADGEL